MAGSRRRESATADLRAQLHRCQALVEYAPDAIVILDLAAGHYVTANAAAEQLLGMSRVELLRVGPAEVSPLVQPDGRPSVDAMTAHLQRALAGERPRFEWVHRRADGTDVPCEVTLLRLPSLDRQLVRGSILDVTGRRKAEAAAAAALVDQAARRSAEAGVARLQATVAGLNAVVWERDPATLRLTFVNERAAELLGYPAERWLADEGLWSRILHPDDRAEVLARVRSEIADGGVDFALSYRVQAADGRWVWLQHLGHVTRDETGTARTLHAVLFDTTEAKRREHATALQAAAARALAGPGSIEERLGAVIGQLTDDLGDWGAVWLRGDDDRYRPVAAAPAALAPRVLALGPLTVPEQFTEEFTAGRAFAVPEVTEALRRTATADDQQYAALTALGGRSWLAAPLTTGGTALGLLTVASGPHGFDDADVALAADLGQRVATMVAGERLAAQQTQLHELTAALAAVGTVSEAAGALTTTLHDVLAASVVAVCALGDDGQLHSIDVHGHSPGWAAGFTTIPMSAPVPLADAARTRRPVWLPDRAALLAGHPDVAPFLQAATQATASLPLLAGHRLVGALSVVFPGPRRFDSAERAFLLTVAGQVAAALERAALADVRREMADTRQRSLLPAELPEVERVAVTARYLPAVAGTAAGGDWYDVLAVADDSVVLAVGDVVGHGAAAAAVMGQLRAGLAGLLLAGHRPARALELLDRLARQIDGARLATVVCLLLERETGRLSYSRAGHPPPLLVDAHGAHLLDDGLGRALGLPDTGSRPEATITLPPGATLLLYTDGLLEHRGATLDDRLAAALTERRTAPLPALVDGVVGALIGDGAADDVAVLAVRRLPEPLRADLPADPTELAPLRRAVTGWAEDAALPEAAAEDLQLALGEAVANAVEHAYTAAGSRGRVRVEVAAETDGGIRVAVADGGTWRPVPIDRGFRGRGLDMIAALTEDVVVDHGPGGTVLRFRLPPGAEPLPAALQAASGAAGSVTLVATDASGRRCIELAGDLDLAGVDTVRAELFRELDGGIPVTLDLTRLGFVASVGLGLLLELRQDHGRAHLDVLLPASGPARRVLDLAGLTDVLFPPGTEPTC